MRIDLLTTRKFPKTAKLQNSNVIGEPPEQTAEFLEPDNIAEIVELTGPKKPVLKLKRLLLYFCWGIFLLSAIFFLIGEYFDYDFSAGELISIQAELDEYRTNLSEERELKNIRQAIQGREIQIAQISSLYPQRITIINNLSNFLPTGVWLTLIQSNAKGEVIVKGQSYNSAKVGDYLKRLKEVELFKSLKLKEIKQRSLARTIFLFTIEIETGGSSLEYTE